MKQFWTNVGEGLGCAVALVGVAILIWALSGFPAFWH